MKTPATTAFDPARPQGTPVPWNKSARHRIGNVFPIGQRQYTPCCVWRVFRIAGMVQLRQILAGCAVLHLPPQAPPYAVCPALDRENSALRREGRPVRWILSRFPLSFSLSMPLVLFPAAITADRTVQYIFPMRLGHAGFMQPAGQSNSGQGSPPRSQSQSCPQACGRSSLRAKRAARFRCSFIRRLAGTAPSEQSGKGSNLRTQGGLPETCGTNAATCGK